MTTSERPPSNSVCRSLEGRPVTAFPAPRRSEKGGGGVRPRRPPPPDGPDTGGAAAETSPWPGGVLRHHWRLISPRPDELLALDRIRHRASRAAACTSVAQLAVDLRTTRTRARHLIDRLHGKGWIVTDSRQAQYLPTSMAALAYRMQELESLVRALAALDARRVPKGLWGMITLARELWDDAGPQNGFVAHPAANLNRSWLSREARRCRGLTRWWRLRVKTRQPEVRARALQKLALLEAAA